MFPTLTVLKLGIGVLLGVLLGAAGFRMGFMYEKAASDTAINKLNAQINTEHTQATTLLQQETNKVIAKQQELDTLKTTLEKNYAIRLKTVSDSFTKHSGDSLRYRAIPGPSGAGSGAAQGGSGSSVAASAGDVAVLPGPVAAGLRQLALDADTLKVEYQKCYEWVTTQDTK